MNKFIGLGVLILGLLVAGSLVIAQNYPSTEYDSSQDLYNPEVNSALNCVKGAVQDVVSTNSDFENCANSTNQPLSNFERSEVNRYLSGLGLAQLEKTTTIILNKTIVVDLDNRERVINSLLDQVGYSSQPCTFEVDPVGGYCGNSRRFHRDENDHGDHYHPNRPEQEKGIGRWY